jgi:ADP-ribose pyrophosphatase
VSAVPVVYAPADTAHGTPLVVLISQYRPPHDELVIEIPAGVRDVVGEADEDNVRRELVEEVGLVPGHLELLTSIYPSAGMTDSVNTIFLATDCTPVERAPHGPEEEHAEIFEVPLAEAIEWVTAGRIVDAKSVVGLLLADRRLHAVR